MKNLRIDIDLKVPILLLLGLVFITSCGPKEYKKIPLEKLDPDLKSKGDVIVNDILTSLDKKEGATFLLNKEYMTPMVHGRIMTNLEMYKDAYKMAPMTIGKVSGYNLFEVIDKGIIKTMRYKLTTDSKDMEFIELKIDINKNYGLADFYLYVTSKNGFLKRENILPKAMK